jgi:trehalose synthase
VSVLCGFDIDTEWLVIGSDKPAYFSLTKRLHNLIHGVGDPRLGPPERELYEDVSRELADQLRDLVTPEDVLVVHDPQPAGMGALVKAQLGVPAIWRCHIGLDAITSETRAAWDFLRPYVGEYDQAIFSAPEYIPEYLAGHASIMHPSIDPLSAKNEDLSAHMLTGVLCNAGIMKEQHPVLTAPYKAAALRVAPDGQFMPATSPEEIGLLYRTSVTQISRWDQLKGWEPLLRGFAHIKRRVRSGSLRLGPVERRRVDICRLVLAGPENSAVADDPEADQVLRGLIDLYKGLDPDVQRDVAILSLPMASQHENWLMVNALQRASSIVVQNSLQEGFGLTVTEAMWKRLAVLGSEACGIRHQIRDGVDGRLVSDPSDPYVVGGVLLELLNAAEARQTYARNAQRRVHDEFLVFTQVRRWLEALEKLTTVRRPHA